MPIQVSLAVPNVSEMELRRRFWCWLDAEEKYRADRLIRSADRQVFLAAHALLRFALTDAARGTLGLPGFVGPADWRFARNSDGKPVLDPRWLVLHPRLADIHFSLSHTVGLVAVAVGQSPIGIDVEPADRPDITPERIATYLTRREQDWLDGQPIDKRRLALLRLWVLKEAYFKARGGGIHLTRFSIFPDAHPPTVVDESPDSVPWRLEYTCWQRSHHLALATQQPPSAPPCIDQLNMLDLTSIDLSFD